MWLSGSQMGGGKPDAPLGGCVWEEEKLKVFRCEAYMLCPVQRGRGSDLLQIPRNQVGVDLFASEENTQESSYCTKGNSAFQFHWGELAEGRVVGQTRGGPGWLWANPPFTEFERVVAKLQCEGTRVVVLAPYWPKQRWFQDLYAMSCAQVMLKRSEAQYRKEGEREFMPLAGWDTMLLTIDTTSTPSPAPHKFLTKGESDARSFVLRARSAGYGEDVCLSGSTGLFPWVTQCEFGLVGQLPVRVLKGGGGLELVMRVRQGGPMG